MLPQLLSELVKSVNKEEHSIVYYRRIAQVLALWPLYCPGRLSLPELKAAINGIYATFGELDFRVQQNGSRFPVYFRNGVLTLENLGNLAHGIAVEVEPVQSIAGYCVGEPITVSIHGHSSTASVTRLFVRNGSLIAITATSIERGSVHYGQAILKNIRPGALYAQPWKAVRHCFTLPLPLPDGLISQIKYFGNCEVMVVEIHSRFGVITITGWTNFIEPAVVTWPPSLFEGFRMDQYQMIAALVVLLVPSLETRYNCHQEVIEDLTVTIDSIWPASLTETFPISSKRSLHPAH